MLTAGVDDGTLRASVDTEAALRVITSSIHGVLDRQRYGSRPNLARSPGLDALSDALVDTLLGGLRS